MIEPETDPDVISQYLEDAAHYPGGRATAVVRPKTIEAVAAAVGAERRGAAGRRTVIADGRRDAVRRRRHQHGAADRDPHSTAIA